MKTSELADAALDWAVAECQGYFSTNGQSLEYWRSPAGVEHFLYMRNAEGHGVHWTHSSTDWSEAGPIIEREKISVWFVEEYADEVGKVMCKAEWYAEYRLADRPHYSATGPTPLIAAMRCYVASRLGDEVELPEELV
jgi:hypothetical protein